MAKSIGIRGDSPEDLAKYDRFYFEYYPYLWPFVSQIDLPSSRVLEIGLGFGTVGERLSQEAKSYVGLDLSSGPVSMLSYRQRLRDLKSRAVVGNALTLPFPSESFDAVVAIGCLHHTGNFPGAIEEVHRVLRPGGHALLMVYHRFSYEQWLRWPLKTMKAWLHERGFPVRIEASSEAQRARYDLDEAGAPPPSTDFYSSKQIETIFKEFQSVSCQPENTHEYFTRRIGWGRERLLKYVGRFGLDLYIKARK